jgi:DnaJ-class molecular chaperone
MVKPNPKKKNKICPRCKGNGFIQIPNKSVEEPGKEVTVSCTMCESQGELYDKNNTFIIDANGVHRLQ